MKNTLEIKYLDLYEEIKMKIENGEFSEDEKLPPIRSLATSKKLNPATVVRAYNLLEKNGYIYKILGSGSFVSRLKKLNIYDENKIELLNQIDFSSTAPSENLLPIKEFQEMLNYSIDNYSPNIFTYQNSQGDIELREFIVNKYFPKSSIKSDNILIISGAQQGLDIISKAVLKRDDLIVTEELSYFGAIKLFKSSNVNIVKIPLESDGYDLIYFENILKKKKVKLAYINTNFHNPTGICWSESKINKMIELSEKYNFLIIEDDAISEINFKNLDLKNFIFKKSKDNIFYLKSFSKIFMPGIRIAFAVVPDKFVDIVISQKYIADIQTSGLTQKSFLEFMKKGYLDKHIKNINLEYGKRFDVLTDCLKKLNFVEFPFENNGGLYFWLSLKEIEDSNSFYNFCLKNGVAFMPGKYFGEKNSKFLRLCTASLDEKNIIQGIKKIEINYNSFLNKTENKNIPII